MGYVVPRVYFSCRRAQDLVNRDRRFANKFTSGEEFMEFERKLQWFRAHDCTSTKLSRPVTINTYPCVPLTAIAIGYIDTTACVRYGTVPRYIQCCMVRYSMYSGYSVYSMYSTYGMYSMHCTVCTAQYVLHSMHSMHCAVCTVQYLEHVLST